MPNSPSIYTPRGLSRTSAATLELPAAAAAARRASARYGTVFADDSSSKGLHAWDLDLRSEGKKLERNKLIEETEKDLHDAVCANIGLVFSIV